MRTADGFFSLDDAMEFVGLLLSRNLKPDHLYHTIATVAGIAEKEDADFGPDSYDAARALAAIEMVAAANGHPSTDLPHSARQWLQKNTPLRFRINEEQRTGLCKQAIQQIRSNSELRDVWEEEGTWDLWRSQLEDLGRRVS